MKIKLAILEKDISYLNRIVSVFGSKYADKFEIYSFSDLDVAMQTIDVARIDVLVSCTEFDVDVDKLPTRCGFAYFVDSIEIDTYKEQRAICKFQKADLIYKQILSIYSESAGSVSGLKFGDDVSKIIFFTSVSGGTGTSSMAVACATHFAQIGKKTLYLNIEDFGSSDVFFSAEGQFDMSDIIFALKSKKTNISLKLESCVKQDQSGVYFYSQSKVALDMLELGEEEIIHLLEQLNIAGSYDYIIVDCRFDLNRRTLDVFKYANYIVWVCDGSKSANSKIIRAFNALSIVEQSLETRIIDRLCLVYNKFSNKNSQTVDELGIKTIGGAPKFEQASVEQIVDKLASMQIFDKIVN